MCGIAGFIDFKNRASKNELIKMTDAVSHRGPDAFGYFWDQKQNYQVGLGHRRLSIIDLSPLGNQPMQSANGRFQIVFNGEIYNFREIKESLLNLGHQFISNSDTEVILHAFEEWGTKSVDCFRGMFAFVIYDVQNERITCFRDRAGVKPFFYYWLGDLFLFASELKSLMAHPGFQKEIDMDATASFFQFGYVPSRYCIFKNTYKLKAGHFLTIDLKTKKIETRQYWNVYDFYNREKLRILFDEAVDETENILTESFSYRMVADVPVGIFLSGGYDSACVTALLQKNSSKRLQTFTIGMQDEKLNEAHFAKEVAKILGTDHHEQYCTEKEARDIVYDLPYYYDEPFGDSSAIPTILVSRMARQHVTVALSADAGDEIFGGYNHYESALKYDSRLRATPLFLRKAGVAMMHAVPVQQLPPFRGNNLLRRKYQKLTNVLRDPGPYSLFINMHTHFSQKEKELIFQNEFRDTTFDYDTNALQEKYFDLLSYNMAIDYNTYLVDDILQKVDRATMSISLEGREPFLDQHIIEWAARLPQEFKINKGERKYILRKIVHKYVPEQLMNRPKKGFAVPVASWLENGLRPLVNEYLNEGFLKKQGLFNWDHVSDIKRQFYNKRKVTHEKMWLLLMFQMWYDKWMDN
jgi:asparagine synthase (glutamine-hydrolysing)